MKKQYTMKLSVSCEKVISKLETAWSIKFCNVELGKFCSGVCKGAYAGSCDSCPVNQAYRAAVQQIKDGVRHRPEVIDTRVNYGAFRHFDRKGHKTEVWHDFKDKEVR